jgi:hypothetical protein
MSSRGLDGVIYERDNMTTKNPLKGIKQTAYYIIAIPVHLTITIIKLPFKILWWIGYTLHTGIFRAMTGLPFIEPPGEDNNDNLSHGHGGAMSIN